jgi:hypothetical protein
MPMLRTHERSLLHEIERESLDDEIPVARPLRKLVSLGGKAQSVELREYAVLELGGYDCDDADLPAYRRPGAVIEIDGVVPGFQISGQQIGPHQLPDVVQEKVGEEVPLPQPIGVIESMLREARAKGGHIKLALPHSQLVASMMNHELAGSSRHVSAVYWSLSVPALEGVTDGVRTTLVRLVAEMRAAMPDDADTPSAAAADQAVNFVVHGGKRSVVNVAVASGSGEHDVKQEPAAMAQSRSPWPRFGAGVVGLATIVATYIALAQWQGCGFPF